LITSREEGGPKGLVEALASSIPVISTPVGMSPDLLPKIENCGVTDKFEINELVKHILNSRENSKSFPSNLSMTKVTRQIDYEVIAKQYSSEVYKRINRKLIK
jgi:glycosyltransferase involved in cell wall biosynthesis